MPSLAIGFTTVNHSQTLALREGHDVLDSAFTGTANQYDSLQIRTSEFAGTAFDPVLEVTYTTPGTAITLQDLNYTYDAVGNITQIIDSSSTDSAKTTVYAYDDLYRLTSYTITNPSTSSGSSAITYQYDILGNITYRSDLGTYTYAGDTSTSPATRYANPHAVTSILKTDGTTADFSYDTNGNVKSDGTLTYTWDYKNRLASSRVGVTTTTYAYNPTDARVSKTTGATTTYYLSDDYSVKDTTSTIYVSGASGLAASVENDPGASSGSPSTTSTNHTDHLGSASIVTDADGAMIELLDYYPYGSERLHTGTVDEQKTYIGEYSDDESGLSYLNARYYDPERGQFLSQDPVFVNLGTQDKRGVMLLLDPQLMNSYQYGRGNPIAFRDGNGEFVETVFDIISIALSAYDYQHSRSFGGAVFLGLDLLGVVPGIPSVVGYVRHGARTLEIANYFHRIAGGGIDTVVRLGGLFVENIGFKFSRRGWTAGEAGNDVANLVGHFVKHGEEVGANTVGQYYQKANDFIGSNRTYSFKDPDPRFRGDTVYFDPKTNEKVVTDSSGNIKSYYIEQRDDVVEQYNQIISN